MAANGIASIGSLTVGGNATLVNGAPLTIDGPFTAANANLAAPTLTLAGLVSLGAGGGALALSNAGTVLESGTGRCWPAR